ncbi:MAG TPA: ABC transporter substrate-binding protein [Thermoanaerobaculia bacterium]
MLRPPFRPLLIPLTVLFGLCASGCSPEKKVGVVLPLTGEYQVYGEESRKGIEMARGSPSATLGAHPEGARHVYSLEAQGGELTATVAVPPEAEALAGTIAEAVASGPDAVLVAGYEPDVGGWIRELRRRGYKGRILSTQAFASPATIHRTGAAAAGVLVSHTAFAPEDDERVASFVERYRARYGGPPGIYAAEGYDAFRVLAAALAGRPALASEVRKGLIHEIKDFPGVTGALQFDETGAVHKIPRVYSIAEDLTLRDHGKWLQAERDRIRVEREKLEKQLQAIRDQAASG